MGHNSAADNAARQARQDELDRQDRVKKGTAALRYQFGQKFDEPYFKGNYDPATNTGDRYSGLAGAGRRFYDPQIEDQYKTSMRALQAALARAGTSRSVSGGNRQNALDLERSTALSNMENSIQGQVSQRREQVANAESTAVGQLQASADPAAAAAQGANLINIESQPGSWTGLGQVLVDSTAGLATQGDLERTGQARYNLGIPGWGNSARRYVRNVSG